MNKELYFHLVDQNKEVKATLEALHNLYNEIWYKEDQETLEAVLREEKRFLLIRDNIEKALKEMREGVDPAIIKAMRNEYYEARA